MVKCQFSWSDLKVNKKASFHYMKRNRMKILISSVLLSMEKCKLVPPTLENCLVESTPLTHPLRCSNGTPRYVQNRNVHYGHQKEY